MEILFDYEEIFKLKEFIQDDNKRVPYENTYERLRNDLKEQYIENLDEKLNRRLSITKVPYFQNVYPIKFYIQAKMLYREGFYEAAITISRGICEMICHNILDKINHPFGSDKELTEENFRTLVNFIAVPKKFEKTFFEKNLVDKIANLDDKNLVKSSYDLDRANHIYKFKNQNGKSSKAAKRLLEIFESLNFNEKEFFKSNTFLKIHQIYDLGNIYIHARKSLNSAKEDAFEIVDSIGYILFELYGEKDSSTLIGKTLFSAYSEFPDICSGVTYYMEAAINPMEASRVYYNLPSQKQIDQFKNACGIWNGEWKSSHQNLKGRLILYIDKNCHLGDECIHGKFILSDEEIQNLSIQLFGDYFRIKGFRNSEKIIEFELSFLNEEILVGDNSLTHRKALFTKVE